MICMATLCLMPPADKLAEAPPFGSMIAASFTAEQIIRAIETRRFLF
jgi:hypothetical protein